jgi:membrane-bound serine protease (ClpP class)
MDLWAWSILLMITGVALVVMEVFIPSGGILGFLAVCAIIAGVVTGFMQGPGTGFAVLATAIFGIPAAVILALKWWPQTPIGRRVLLGSRGRDEVIPDDPKRRSLKEFQGRIGRAQSKMLPSGVIVIDGRKVDAVSEGMPIEPGQKVRVLHVRGRSVVVRPVPEDTPERPAEDPLSRPVDTVVPDPFEEPPA